VVEKIKDFLYNDEREMTEFVRERALDASHEQLIKIGFAPTSVSITQTRFSGVVGAVGIANRNIALVELERKLQDREAPFPQYEGTESTPDSMYRCNYVMHANMDGLEKNLSARSKLVSKGIRNRLNPTEIKWKGKELAQVLNRDSLTLLPNVRVLPDRKHQRVIIRQERYWDSWLSAFPTVETFKAFDRIAHCVKGIVNG